MSPEPPSIFGVRSLERSSARISVAEAAAIADEHWGIGGLATELPAEVDENFRLVCASRTLLLKVVPAEEPAELTDLVTQALIHVHGRVYPGLTQEVLKTRTGANVASFEDSAGRRRTARLSSFIEGTVMRSAALDRTLRVRLGRTLARLAVALRTFDHPAASRELSWDLRYAGRMQAMLAELTPSSRRRALGECLADFDAEIVPRLEPLPVQTVHNDLSKDNAVLTEDGRIGVIDFGDIVRTQRVNDVAVAMADQLGSGMRPFAPSLELAHGYLDVLSLEAEEIALLYPLVRARVATRIVGGEWRAERFPENREYLARNVERLWAIFARLPAVATPEDAAQLKLLAEETGA